MGYSIVSRGHLRAMQIWRRFYAKMLLSYVKLFKLKSDRRPMLEYCSPIWFQVTVTLMNQLEHVQLRFTKRLPGFQSSSYDERCALLAIDYVDYVQI